MTDYINNSLLLFFTILITFMWIAFVAFIGAFLFAISPWGRKAEEKYMKESMIYMTEINKAFDKDTK